MTDDRPESYVKNESVPSGEIVRFNQDGTEMDLNPIEHKPVFDLGHYLESLCQGFGAERFAFMPKLDRRYKADKAKYEAFMAEAGGKVVIPEEDAEIIRKLADSVKRVRPLEGVDRFPVRDQLLTVEQLAPFFEYQKEVYWEFEGIKKKALMDAYGRFSDTNVVLDWKWTGSFPGWVSGLKGGRWIQSEHYSEGATEVFGGRTVFVYVVAEHKAPFVARAVTLDPDTAGLRREAYLDLCQRYDAWNRNGRKPNGYGKPETIKIWV